MVLRQLYSHLEKDTVIHHSHYTRIISKLIEDLNIKKEKLQMPRRHGWIFHNSAVEKVYNYDSKPDMIKEKTVKLKIFY